MKSPRFTMDQIRVFCDRMMDKHNDAGWGDAYAALEARIAAEPTAQDRMDEINGRRYGGDTTECQHCGDTGWRVHAQVVKRPKMKSQLKVEQVNDWAQPCDRCATGADIERGTTSEEKMTSKLLSWKTPEQKRRERDVREFHEELTDRGMV